MNILLIGDTIKSKNLGCQLVSHSFREGFKKYFSEESVTYLDLFKPTSYVSPNYDKVIVNGEGAISKSVNENIYNPVVKCLEEGIPTHFTNFTYDPRIIRGKEFTPSINYGFEKEWMDVFKRCVTVSVRDPISYQYLKERGIKEVKLYPDIGFTIGNNNSKERSNRVLLGLGSITKRADINKNQIKMLINNITELNYEVYLLDWPSHPHSDGYYLQGLANNQNVFYKQVTFQEYFELCQTSKLNITGRHHGVVMSAAAQCPYITFETNMWKTEGDNLLYGPLYYHKFNNLFGAINIKEILANTNKDISKLKKTYKKLVPYEWGHLLQNVTSIKLEEKEEKEIMKYLETTIYE